jgi:tetratricopeptide (TPR) repeat protein
LRSRSPRQKSLPLPRRRSSKKKSLPSNNGSSERSRPGHPDEKIRLYNEALRIKPDYADAFINRGNARYDKGDLEGADEDFKQAQHLKAAAGT